MYVGLKKLIQHITFSTFGCLRSVYQCMSDQLLETLNCDNLCRYCVYKVTVMSCIGLFLLYCVCCTVAGYMLWDACFISCCLCWVHL